MPTYGFIAHHYLYNQLGILHCDLSPNNILLHRKDGESEAIGLLIDFDHSVGTKAVYPKDPQRTMTGDCATDAAEDVAGGRIPTVSEPNPHSRPTFRAVRLFIHLKCPSIHNFYYQGTLPFMAVEALLGINQTFIHKPQHDLESILYIILYFCTFVCGPGLPPSQHASPPIRTWFCSNDITEIGYQKLAHLECYKIAILPYFTPYWCDFTPFVSDLIMACFPVRVRLPSDLRYDQMLRILNTAYHSVEECQTGRVPASKVLGAQHLTQTPKRVASDSLDRASKKERHF